MKNYILSLMISLLFITGCEDIEIVANVLAPVANNDTVTVNSGNTIVIDILDNDIDSDGTIDSSSVTIVDNVEYGSALINTTTGEVSYTADNNFTGIEIFSYQVKDNAGQISNIATVSIEVSFEPPRKIEVEENAKEWYVRIIVEDTTNNLKTAGAQLGQLDIDDVVTKQSLKAIAPFSTASFLDVVFENPVGVDAGEYKSNFHLSSTDEDSWEFTVKSHDPNAIMIISWRGLYVLIPYTDNEGRERYHEYRSVTNPVLQYMSLVDVSTNTEINVLEDGLVNTYIFSMDGVTERTFRWKVKDSSSPLEPKQKKVVSTFEEKLQKLQVKVLRKDAKATPTKLKNKRLESFDMMTPPTFEVLVK